MPTPHSDVIVSSQSQSQNQSLVITSNQGLREVVTWVRVNGAYKYVRTDIFSGFWSQLQKNITGSVCYKVSVSDIL